MYINKNRQLFDSAKQAQSQPFLNNNLRSKSAYSSIAVTNMDPDFKKLKEEILENKGRLNNSGCLIIPEDDSKSVGGVSNLDA